MRILDVINKTTPYLEKQGVESPRLTIELLLAHLLQQKRLQLYLDFERELPPAQLDRLREMVKRRVAGEPLQYITGEAEFCGLKFTVDRRVLIPRPETELLVETVARQLSPSPGPLSLLDLCTGSGCIAIALAKRLPTATIHATDASPDALAVAALNASRHGVQENVRFFPGDLLQALPSGLNVYAVVSNPPYIASGDLRKLPKEVVNCEPVQALDGGVDGLDFYRRILRDAPPFLEPDGCVCFELGAGQRTAVQQLAESLGYQVAEVVKDLQDHERVVVLKR